MVKKNFVLNTYPCHASVGGINGEKSHWLIGLDAKDVREFKNRSLFEVGTVVPSSSEGAESSGKLTLERRSTKDGN